MFVPFLLFICLTVTFSGTCKATASETEELGTVIDLRRTNLLAESIEERETSIFEPLPSKCFKKKTLKSSSSHFQYYANNKAFYKSLGTQSSLGASLESRYSLGATLDIATMSKSSKTSNVSGTSLIVQALTEKIHVDKNCLEDDQVSTLQKRFVKKFERLPLKIKKPWLKNSWKRYRNILKSYGSHVLMSETRGSSIRQMTFAESSKSYSERDLQVKACTSLAGPTPVGKLNISACSNVSQNELSRASKVSTSDKLNMIGGRRETKSKLVNKRTPELIEQLMNEADDSPSPVERTFRAVWNILQARFKEGSPNNIRAANLEYFYLGFLNYGCRYKKSGGVEIKKFDYTKNSNQMNPEYTCSLAAEGCHSDSDCHYRGLWCSCRGRSCILYKFLERDTGPKITAYANTKRYKKKKGCQFSWFQCKCKNKSRSERKEVWSLPSNDAVSKKSPISNVTAIE
ncbi:hypothetical protein OS493_012220 [Desmophyllum pertusum]|uniref:MACPF domain-containing protein n=1 Tax=Desmophyllum pertusum TaxID=174260 RepID=A0A9X0DBE4_9CNID|nr:hypothetical protein OS493_012220 [Desmophyllum pertusum]